MARPKKEETIIENDAKTVVDLELSPDIPIFTIGSIRMSNIDPDLPNKGTFEVHDSEEAKGLIIANRAGSIDISKEDLSKLKKILNPEKDPLFYGKFAKISLKGTSAIWSTEDGSIILNTLSGEVAKMLDLEKLTADQINSIHKAIHAGILSIEHSKNDTLKLTEDEQRRSSEGKEFNIDKRYENSLSTIEKNFKLLLDLSKQELREKLTENVPTTSELAVLINVERKTQNRKDVLEMLEELKSTARA